MNPAPAGPANSQAAAAGMDVVRVLMRGKVTIVGCTILGLLLAYLYFLGQPARYRSAGRLLVLHETPNLAMANGQMGSSSYADEQALTSRLAAHANLLTSTEIAKEAVKAKDLGKLRSLAGAADPAAAIAGGMVARRVTTDRSNEVTNVLQVSYAGPNPSDTKEILSAVFAAYEVFLKELDTTGNNNNRDSLNEIKTNVDKKLGAIEAELKNLQTALSEPGFTVADLLSVEDELRHLKEQIGKYNTYQEIANGQLRSIGELRKAGLGDVEILRILAESHQRDGVNADHDKSDQLSNPMAFAQMFIERARLEAKGFGPASKEIKQMDAGIRALAELIGMDGVDFKRPNLLGMHIKFLNGLVMHYEGTKKFHDKRLAELTLKAGKARAHRLSENALEAKKVELHRMTEMVGLQLSNLDLSQKIGGYKAIVIDQPKFGAQTDPDFSRIMTMGFVMGLAGGLLIAYLMELSDKSFKSPDEIRQQLGLNVLGHVPVLPAPEAKEKLVQPTNGAPQPDRTLFAYHRPRSRLAEAYRAVRTALYFGSHGASHRILQVTSPNPGDGKSTLSSNLAASIAQSGKRVLLIDADFRRPRAHKLFHITSRVGVTAVIQGAASIEEATHVTAVENLWLMPCGARPDNPAELLTSPKFEELLNQVRDLYDWVIVDTPPLLAVTDPCAVAARVDAVIVTIRVGPRSRSAIVRSTEMLENIGASILGVVVNGVGPADNQGEHGYNAMTYGYGSKYYQYGQEYYIAGDGDNPNYGYDDSPSGRSKNGRAPSNGANGANGAHGPVHAAPPYTNGAPPTQAETSPKNDPPRPQPPSTLQDLLRKHQHPGSPPNPDA